MKCTMVNKINWAHLYLTRRKSIICPVHDFIYKFLREAKSEDTEVRRGKEVRWCFVGPPICSGMLPQEILLIFMLHKGYLIEAPLTSLRAQVDETVIESPGELSENEFVYAAEKVESTWTACRYSFVPRPFPAPVFDYLQYSFLHTASDQKLKLGKAWNEATAYIHM